jgi:hypothetical protein
MGTPRLSLSIARDLLARCLLAQALRGNCPSRVKVYTQLAADKHSDRINALTILWGKPYLSRDSRCSYR